MISYTLYTAINDQYQRHILCAGVGATNGEQSRGEHIIRRRHSTQLRVYTQVCSVGSLGTMAHLFAVYANNCIAFQIFVVLLCCWETVGVFHVFSSQDWKMGAI